MFTYTDLTVSFIYALLISLVLYPAINALEFNKHIHYYPMLTIRQIRDHMTLIFYLSL
jgi:hypothetical protein